MTISQLMEVKQPLKKQIYPFIFMKSQRNITKKEQNAAKGGGGRGEFANSLIALLDPPVLDWLSYSHTILSSIIKNWIIE